MNWGFDCVFCISYYLLLYCIVIFLIQSTSYEFKSYVIFPELLFFHAIRWIAISCISCITQHQTITM